MAKADHSEEMSDTLKVVVYQRAQSVKPLIDLVTLGALPNRAKLEEIGTYFEEQSGDGPALISIDSDRAKHWMKRGARPSRKVRKMFLKLGIVTVEDKHPDNEAEDEEVRTVLESLATEMSNFADQRRSYRTQLEEAAEEGDKLLREAGL